MTSQELVQAAFEFRPPDRIPRMDNFWDYPEEWARRLGPKETLSDIEIWNPEEGTFPTRARTLREENGWTYSVDSWGRTIRQKADSYFAEVLRVPIPEGTDPEKVEYDPPDLDSRYLPAGTPERTREKLQRDKDTYFLFGTVGGPYLRNTFVRGEEQFLMDIAGDPELARMLAEKMADHLIGVAREQLRRWSLQDTGIWISDDMACNRGPMFSPKSFEKVFLPAYGKMVHEIKRAGAKYVLLHSDGNIMPILDMLVEAGIDGINPLERRTGMDAGMIRKRHPNLILIGGMCNTDTLPHGPAERIEAETRELIDLGRNGGLVIGAHSISPEIPLEYFLVYDKVCRTYGTFCDS
jgi:uroporphyrinogen-III decarboxylase